ncbi:MAG TPA: COX15/CtaA family protein [Giesbergeria sp.]|jgi:cytochrome c oxidase assembly protein subunit 15|uniref:COX15/CtaA family protein n=1 Tax=Comamonadaceae TaxID=80864 RepID=UPI0013896410|nr:MULTISPECIES: COX15/CtaA family protein [unclassified Acidovorax]MBL8363725.1 COX15/CtaA family protein [Comamonas sp.]MCL4770330.1 COX15/CtaA family protein [Burkholderiaceae bacterium]HMZ85542.1 COX15/CtaA family protein [Giesbergeria sp.]NCU67230.1 heme A synthase [Acidovorax sp. 210-6]HNE70720.1 COX15/CtaA family protein [Giesbergeria sp.]
MNETQALYDYAPLLQLMLLGATIALGPLAWVAWRSRGGARGKRLQALMVLTLFLTFDLVMFGAFTRLTDSGLGCPDWPGCYGNASPIGAREEISAAQDAMPTGPVTHGKAWVEMIHRYLASAVGVLIIAINVGVWRQKRQWQREGRTGDEPLHPGWAVATLVWVCLQGVFGAWTVTMKLFPAIVTLHLIGGLVLLALLCAQAVRQVRTVQGVQPVQLPVNLRWAMVAALALVWIQVALGGWVSTNYAVLACTTFPTCQGSWWPAMDFAQGFEIWRPLGLLKDGSHIGFAALTAIHYVHRLFAYLVLVVLVVLGLRMLRAGDSTHPVAAQGRWLLALAALQLVTGLSNVILDWPLAAAVLHTGGAAALVGVLTWALAASEASASQAVLVSSNTPLATAKAKA